MCIDLAFCFWSVALPSVRVSVWGTLGQQLQRTAWEVALVWDFSLFASF